MRALPDHRLLDRLIGGRVWIILLGTLLVGIVTMQLSLLRMNAGIGLAVEKSSMLEQRNATLRQSISQLSDTKRIVALATEMGFVTPPQGSPRFLSASAADAGKALTTMRVPDPAALAAAAAAEAAAEPTATDTTGTTTPVDTTTPDATAPAAPTAPETTATAAPDTTTATPPATGTTAPATGIATPVASPAPVAGGASAPQG
ncbi:MAG: hypothetical protein ACJ76L_06130 [Conexibacter sp.]